MAGHTNFKVLRDRLAQRQRDEKPLYDRLADTPGETSVEKGLARQADEGNVWASAILLRKERDELELVAQVSKQHTQYWESLAGALLEHIHGNEHTSAFDDCAKCRKLLEEYGD